MARGTKVDTSPPLQPEALLDLSYVSRETLNRFEIYADLLDHWQRRINLVSQDSLRDCWRRHFLDSVQLAQFIGPKDQVITDLGTGAGFPGMVLAIAMGRATHLVESNAKKCAFLREVARRTNAPVTIHNGRIEDLEPWATDIIVARALAPLGRLLALSDRFSDPERQKQPICVFLKGETAASELTQAEKVWKMRAQLADSLSDPSGRIVRVSSFSKIR